MNYLSRLVLGNRDQSLVAIIPQRQLMHQSVQIVASTKTFNGWTEGNHADSYHFMKRIAQAWKISHLAHQYMIYGKIDTNIFTWEIVPYQKCKTLLGRIIQQLQVLWRAVFVGRFVSEESKLMQQKKYEVLLNKSPEGIIPSQGSNPVDDSFCKKEVIDRQWVITGKKVNVLFNYSPVGFGGEKLHFLVVTKEHRETFIDVTQEEYCESLSLTKKLVDHFNENRKTIKGVYLINKTGVDAGQTVNHWHLHVIFSTNATQDFWGKITVLKNIFLRSSPMNKNDLEKRVMDLKKELVHLST